MNKLKVLLWIIGAVQIVLGLGLLFAPAMLIEAMGLSEVPSDAYYLLGMLAARFLAYGVGMFYISRDPAKHIFWIRNMLYIQVIDLAVGIFYTINGTLALATSAFPMFNAALFSALLLAWSPRTKTHN